MKEIGQAKLTLSGTGSFSSTNRWVGDMLTPLRYEKRGRMNSMTSQDRFGWRRGWKRRIYERG